MLCTHWVYVICSTLMNVIITSGSKWLVVGHHLVICLMITPKMYNVLIRL